MVELTRTLKNSGFSQPKSRYGKNFFFFILILWHVNVMRCYTTTRKK